MSVTLLVFMLFFVMMATRNGRRGHRHDALEPSSTRRELDDLRRAVDELSSRFHRLETERDFYRELLDPPAPRETALAEPADTGGVPAEGSGSSEESGSRTSPLTRP